MSDHIKTEDLCERCYYMNDGCVGRGCNECEMANEKGYCKCVCEVQYNTPCPYFKEESDG